jgi:hypothetical protein
MEGNQMKKKEENSALLRTSIGPVMLQVLTQKINIRIFTAMKNLKYHIVQYFLI